MQEHGGGWASEALTGGARIWATFAVALQPPWKCFLMNSWRMDGPLAAMCCTGGACLYSCSARVGCTACAGRGWTAAIEGPGPCRTLHGLKVPDDHGITLSFTKVPHVYRLVRPHSVVYTCEQQFLPFSGLPIDHVPVDFSFFDIAPVNIARWHHQDACFSLNAQVTPPNASSLVSDCFHTATRIAN